MQKRLTVLTLITAVLFAAEAIRADYGYVFDQTNYPVSLGATVDVLVYLQETGTSIFRDEGLIGAGVKVRFDDPPRPSQPAEVLTGGNVDNVSDFEVVWSKSAQPGAGYADLSLGTFFGDVFGAESPVGTYRVLLGKFTFTAGMAPNEVTYIRATDFSPVTDDTVYCRNGDPLDSVALDGLIQEGTATITTLPEPTAIVLLVIGLLSVAPYAFAKYNSVE